MFRVIGAALLLLLSAAGTAEQHGAAAEEKGPVYELRTYTTNEGKLGALQARFRDHTMSLFEKHGIRNVAYWIPVDKADTLIYVIAHGSRQAAEQSWKAFGADPAWQQVYKDSIADGRLVNNIESVFMTATDYSPGI